MDPLEPGERRPRVALLLGSSGDVRLLTRFLEDMGCEPHAPDLALEDCLADSALVHIPPPPVT